MFPQCKSSHNTALCCVKYSARTAGSNKEETNLTITTNLATQPTNQQSKESLLLFKEVKVTKRARNSRRSWHYSSVLTFTFCPLY